MTANNKRIELLQSLHRGELAATETYQQAMDKLGENDPDKERLSELHADHRDAANHLRVQIRADGGTPDQDSGLWGAWAKLVEGTATVLGKQMALRALKTGEEKGKQSYEKLLRDESLPEVPKMFISRTLLPRTLSHIQELDLMLSKP